MSDNFTQYTFTPSVKAQQERYGSRTAYARMEESGDRNRLGGEEKAFIMERDGFYMSTVGENGWPYVQFRGGPSGFVRVLDDQTLAMADFRGNRQYISTGNLEATSKAMLFFMDYPAQERLKVWAEVQVYHGEETPKDLAAAVLLDDYRAVVERVMVFKIKAFDWNCPQHIPQRYTLEEIAEQIQRGNPEFLELYQGGKG